MRQDFFEFDTTALPIVAANHEPQLRHTDDAMRRRLHLVEFSATFKDSPEEGELQADVTLAKRLAGEHPAILAWMVEGLRSYYAEGLAPPEAVTQRTEDYFGEQDAIGEFLRQECWMVADGTVGARDLYQHYVLWAQGEGLNPLGSRHFGEEMNTRARRLQGIHRVKTMKGWFYRGVQTHAPISVVGKTAGQGAGGRRHTSPSGQPRRRILNMHDGYDGLCIARAYTPSKPQFGGIDGV